MQDLLDAILQSAKEYNYPSFHIAVSGSPSAELDFGHGVYGTFVVAHDPMTLLYDKTVYRLLVHNCPGMQTAGVSSVIFWGYATFNAGLGKFRVRRFLAGLHEHQGPTARVQDAIAVSRTFLSQGEYGRALGALGHLRQLGRTPFASKVIAFLDPENTGVYDNNICNKLESHPLLRKYSQHAGSPFFGARNGVGSVSSGSVQGRYKSWCETLQDLTQRLNCGMRAVDVERAIFAMK